VKREADGALVVRVDTGTVELVPDPDMPDAWLLRLNGTAQSHVDLNDPMMIAFDYIRRMADVIDVLTPAGPLDVLHLGGGALTLPRCLALMRPGSSQRVVEIDAGLARLVLSRLPLDPTQDIEVIIDDARKALEELPSGQARVIVADMFTGSKTPAHVTTVEFARQAARVLDAGGIYLANVMESAPLVFARRQAATLRQAFDQVAVVADAALLRGRGTGNLLMVAADRTVDLKPLVRRISADPTRVRVEHGASVTTFIGALTPITDDRA
jgi:spermidine synthase